MNRLGKASQVAPIDIGAHTSPLFPHHLIVRQHLLDRPRRAPTMQVMRFSISPENCMLMRRTLSKTRLGRGGQKKVCAHQESMPVSLNSNRINKND